ncbi:toll/interleukin-1 receptor domain-containing protein [Peribacillus butanolivorans]|uniref:toll/interleukin-1 receptor domain-containing protein n=1 Tax=Peribacillus butanolivorans TaxID=421767 RepID=UPI0039FD91FD
MEKPKVFISHVKEEKDLAIILKEEINKAFLGLPDVFVSSDGESISIGTRWLDEIDTALKNAQIILLLCSKEAVKRPWINFEAGAGWVKGIPVIPICHTNIKPVELPIPLNMLQGIEAGNKDGLKKIFEMVGKQLGVTNTPEVQYERIIEGIRSFEKQYGIVEVVKFHVNQIISVEPQLKQLFVPNPSNKRGSGYMRDLAIDKMKPHLIKLKEMGFIDFGLGANQISFGPNGGNEVEFNLVVFDAYYEIADMIINK